MIASFSLILLLVALGLFVAFGALVLRIACKIYNYFVGGYQAAELEVNEDIRDESFNVSGPADPNPFAAPREYVPRAELSPEIGVRVPTYLSALFIIGILVLTLLVFAAVGLFGIRQPGARTAGGGLSSVVLLGAVVYLVEYLVLSFLLKALLPTRFVKALIVSKLFFVFWIAVICALSGVAMFVSTYNFF